MSEYKHTVAKQQSGGFAESPEQRIGNAGEPSWFDSLTKKQKIIALAGVVQAKRAIGTTYQAIAGQLGSARLEEQMTAFTRLATLGLLARLSGGLALPGLVAAGEVFVFGINNLVDTHALNLANTILRATRGVSVTYNAGGYYG